MREYVVIYERGEDGGWGATFPDLPNVFALGATREEVAARAQEAVAAYKEDLDLNGGSMPEPVHTTGVVRG